MADGRGNPWLDRALHTADPPTAQAAFALAPTRPRSAGYHRHPMSGIPITDIEAAINYWRARAPSPDGVLLAAPLQSLAEVYALMVFHHKDGADEHSLPADALTAWLAWYDSMPDTPCIAICSTSQGDDHCKGCGRRFDEVQRWIEMTPGEKRSVWHRITTEGTAWRFNRYAERVQKTGKPVQR